MDLNSSKWDMKEHKKIDFCMNLIIVFFFFLFENAWIKGTMNF